jgi:hypothetical protein
MSRRHGRKPPLSHQQPPSRLRKPRPCATYITRVRRTCAQTLFGPTLRWQLAPTSRDLLPAEYDRPFDGEVKIFDELDQKALRRTCGRTNNLRPGDQALRCA